MRRILWLAALLLPLFMNAQGAAPAAKSAEWNGYRWLDFDVAGRPCLLIVPKTPAPGNPWIWRAENFGEAPQVDLALLARGWHVGYIDARDLYGAPQAISLMGQFYARVVTQAGLAKRVVLEGFGSGGLYAFNFAAAHPTRVAALYLDAPALDIRSWPGRNRDSTEWRDCLEAYHLTAETLSAFKGNPLDYVPLVAAAKVPIIVVAGDADRTVPFAENTAVLEKRYREQGGSIQVIVKPGADHQPPGLPDSTAVVDFLVQNAKP
ncbi:MAG TPA: prolyl oligopeptidase family serine peptidase [Opitutaceae bacterium]|nr:prolyl oligopeptidase family serine peptidase [Opitutaceae bacterium]